ncbi:uncharacterized protein LOC132630650 [Lycium barbarum]|uniref:uncharacterized protein LOC132630650 n=1 Tax=Lycium barbarum TaxID=112863 RepID=UPI00293E9A30|nr:uncharacterized protein LOC132630650 [Lycium barbarum]
MDFITGLPCSHQIFDSIWVIVNRLTKSAHFLPIKTTYTTEDYARLYIREIMRLHGILISIISDRHTVHSKLLEILSERAWHSVGEASLFGPDLVHQAIDKIKLIKEQLHTTQSRRKSYTDMRCRELEFQVTENLSYEEEPITILDRQVRRLRTKDVALVKVLWKSKDKEELTWEAEAEMKSKYPYRFPVEANVTSEEFSLPVEDFTYSRIQSTPLIREHKH